jgi:peptide/nickel transport system substrate-binding protein
MRRPSFRWFGVGLTVLTVAVAAAGCSSDDSSESKTGPDGKQPTKRGGNLTFARAFEPVTFHPLQTEGDNGSLWDMAQIFDQLVEYQVGSFDVQPDLAKSWEVSDDGLTYTFTLGEAKFSDGSPVTAEDVKFSIDRFGDPEVNKSFAAFLAPAYKSSEITDPSTFVIHLSRPDAGFLSALATPIASITPEKVIKQVGEKAFGEKPIGSGPFVLDGWVRGKFVKLARNPNYRDPDSPILDGVTINYVPNDNTRLLQVREGQADVAEAIPFQQVAELDAQPDITVQSNPIVAYDAIWLNNTYKPLSDKKVRQALNYALDKDAINEAVYAGKGEVANSTMAKLKYWSADVPAYAADVEKAKQLMSESSYSSGFDLSLKVPAGDSVHNNLAVIAKDAWSKLGINVSIQSVETNSLFSAFSEGDYQAAIPLPKITSDVLVPDELALAWLHWSPGYQSFFTQYKSKKVGDLVIAANRATDEDERAQLWLDLQRQTMDDAPWVPIVFPPAMTAVRSNVENFQTLKSGWWPLAEVGISP